QRQQGDQRDDEKPSSDLDDEGARAADRVAEQPDRGAGVRRVIEGVERAVEGEVEAHIEQPQNRQRAESESAEEGEDPCGPRWQYQHEDNEEQALDRDPEKRARRQVVDPVRHEERGPDQEQGQGRGYGAASARWASGEGVSRKDAG